MFILFFGIVVFSNNSVFAESTGCSIQDIPNDLPFHDEIVATLPQDENFDVMIMQGNSSGNIHILYDNFTPNYSFWIYTNYTPSVGVKYTTISDLNENLDDRIRRLSYSILFN